MLQEKKFPLREVLEAVSRRRRWVLAIAGTGTLLALATMVGEPLLYSASATLAIDPGRGRVTVSPELGPAVQSTDRVSLEEVNQHVHRLRSRELMRQLVEQYGGLDDIQAKPSLSPFAMFNRLRDAISPVIAPDPATARAEVMGRLLTVESINRANLIGTTFTSEDPQEAVAILGQLIELYLQNSLELDRDSQAMDFLGRQRLVQEERLRSARERLDTYLATRGLEEKSGDLRAHTIEINDLESSRAKAAATLAGLDARTEFLAREIAKLEPHVEVSEVDAESEGLRTLRAHLVELEIEKADLLTRYAPGSSVIRSKEQQIAEIERQMERARLTPTRNEKVSNPTYRALETQILETQAERAGLRANVASLDFQIDARRNDLARLTAAAPDLARLQSELDSAQAAWQNYLRKEEDTRFAMDMDRSNILSIHVVDPPRVDAEPIARRRLLRLAIAALVWLAIGLVAGYLRDRLDPHVKSSHEIERLTGAPVIAEIA